MKERKKDFSIIAIICIIITTLFTSYKYSEIIAADIYTAEQGEAVSSEPEISPEEEEEELDTPVIFKAYISGEVLSPGVYELAEGARAADLLDMAGGVLESGDLTKINLASYVSDAEHVYVPAIGEESEEEADEDENDEAETEAGLVNINTASLKRLTSLPGIGDVIGQNIIAYREANGGFKSKEEIKNVSRIGDKLYEQIKELITID